MLTLNDRIRALRGLIRIDRRAPDAEAKVTKAETLVQRLDHGLDVNAAYLALTTPTAAQTAAQVKALTREVSALIRLARANLNSTD